MEEYPFTCEIIYIHNNSLSSRSQIDYWLVSKELDNVLTDIFPSPLSDHKTIHIFSPLVHFSTIPKSSYYKFKNTILKHKVVVAEIDRIIRYYWNKAINEKLFSNNWELLKYENAKYLRKYGSDLMKKRRAEET